MKQLVRYLKALNLLARRMGLQIETQTKGEALVVNGVPFVTAGRLELTREQEVHKGFLLPSLTEDEKQYCLNHRVNYLTLDGQFQLMRDQTMLSISHEKKTRMQTRKAKTPKIDDQKWVSPTLIISPYSLSILDILFRLPDSELMEAPSALSFSKKYDLYQPKLSKLMREMGAKSLTILKQKISSLPEDWWLLAFQYPATKKRLTPFFAVAKPFHTLEVKQASEKAFNLAILKAQGSLIPGPVEVAKKFGMMNDTDYYLWGTAEALQNLKRQHRLVPGKAATGPTWHLAVPTRDLHQEAIASHLKYESPHAVDLANPFRAIWDLSFGSERLKEVRMNLLWSLLE